MSRVYNKHVFTFILIFFFCFFPLVCLFFMLFSAGFFPWVFFSDSHNMWFFFCIFIPVFLFLFLNMSYVNCVTSKVRKRIISSHRRASSRKSTVRYKRSTHFNYFSVRESPQFNIILHYNGSRRLSLFHFIHNLYQSCQ